MALNRLGDFIEQTEEKNSNLLFNINDVRGISIKKIFIPTRADLDGVPLTSYKVVKPHEFCYVTITSRNGEKITISINDSDRSYICSSSYIAFRIKDITKLLPFYLYIYFNRPEFDRYSRFNSWGSAREAFGWNDMCDITINIPPINVQQKVVDVYLAMIENQKVYEKRLDNLRMTYEGYIENLRRIYPSQNIGKYLRERTESNYSNKYSRLVGIGKEGFIKPNQIRSEDSLKKCNVFYKNDFVYAPSSLVNGVISISKFNEPMICTEEYIVFYSIDEDILLPEYLLLWAKRLEFGRRIQFNSMDSVRNRYYFKQFQEEISIPLPSIETQRNIVKIFAAYEESKEISNNLQQKISNLCSILIKGNIS